MATRVILTGIKPTGDPHLGNYLGAILPARTLAQANPDHPKLFFIADAHALTTLNNPQQLQQFRRTIAATWLAFFTDVPQCYFYFQSDIAAIFELYWILSCVCPKGLLNRAHAYKSLVAANTASHTDPDRGINHGLFSYPVLMAADILLFGTTHVPAGADQKQHVEIAVELAKQLNRHLKTPLPIPQPIIPDKAEVIPGIDGQKMSKNYNNTLPLFAPPPDLKKRIAKIKTASMPLGTPLDWTTCLVYQLFTHVAPESAQAALKADYESGRIGFGQAKEALFTAYTTYFQSYGQAFENYIKAPHTLDQIMQSHTVVVRDMANQRLQAIKQDLGLQ
jgi:tryptophanyl-tRNA synthetase